MGKKVCTQFNNKATGTQFEQDFAKILAKHGFWAHRMQDNKNGQPFDIIAAKNGNVYAIDCKDCQSEVFLLKRMEENQRNAMDLWKECGNREPVFAVRYPGHEIWLFGYSVLCYLETKGWKQIRRADAETAGMRLEEFLEYEHRDWE